ncbi:permease [Vibrio tritonius]|uniref:permease n=1 Tax=Vibrio tritonius TaxID=1435069 RepID=UPI00315C5E36
MGMLNSFLRNPKVNEAIAEDCRKVGVTLIGVGVVGITVNIEHVNRLGAYTVLLCGFLVYTCGIALTVALKTEDSEE